MPDSTIAVAAIVSAAPTGARAAGGRTRPGRFASLGLALAMLGAGLGGCIATQPPAVSSDAQPFEQATAAATDNLVRQTLKIPAFIAKYAPLARSVMIDPMLDTTTGQQTALTHRLEESVGKRLQALQPPYELLPYDTAQVAKATYTLTGTLTREPAAAGAKAGQRSPFRIQLALVDAKNGTVVAQSWARALDDQLDTTPTPYYRESPVLVKDAAVDAYLRTTATPAGQPADPAYLRGLNASIAIQNATVAYNGNQYDRAYTLYKEAETQPGGDQLRTLTGQYLASLKLGRIDEAEQAFGKVVSHGLANQSLGLKLLFNPGSTEFWSDTRVSGQYGMWLRQIAKQAAASKACLDIVGHTSRTGGEAFNDKLSEQRASVIRQKLAVDAPDLTVRTKARGMGFHQNLVGTGADDASDALDRRVEFLVQPCAAG